MNIIKEFGLLVMLLTAIMPGVHGMQKGDQIRVKFDKFKDKHNIEVAYELGNSLGIGATAEVHEAYVLRRQIVQTSLEKTNKKVALKMMMANKKPMAEKECKVSAILQDNATSPVPGLVCLHGSGEIISENGPEEQCSLSQVIAMDLVRGRTVKEYLRHHNLQSNDPRNKEPLNLLSLVLVVDLLRLFDIVHSHRIEHNDVHAGNIMLEVSDEGVITGIKLIDFGSAKIFNEGCLVGKTDVLKLVITICTITGMPSGIFNDLLPTDESWDKRIIEAMKNHFGAGTPLFEAMRDIFIDVARPQPGDKAFNYKGYIGRFCKILKPIESVEREYSSTTNQTSEYAGSVERESSSTTNRTSEDAGSGPKVHVMSFGFGSCHIL